MNSDILQRDDLIDIAKGIGILLVVLVHAGTPHSEIVNRFHMAMFFLLSGYTFKDKYLESLHSICEFVKRRIVGLYIPFVCFNLYVLLTRNILISVNILTDNPAFLEPPVIGGGNTYGMTERLSISEMKTCLTRILMFVGEQQLGGATWFLRVLFFLSLVWIVVNHILHTFAHFSDRQRKMINIVISLSFLFVSYEWQLEGKTFVGIVQFETVFAAYIMYCMGYYLGQQQLKMLSKRQCMVLGILALVILLKCNQHCNKNGWSLSVNYFDNPYVFLISSISGSVCVLAISSILNEYRNIAVDVLKYAGRHSLAILLWHFLCFKIVTLVQVYIFDFPMYRLASFPVLYAGEIWWIAYVMVGIGVPLCITFVIRCANDMLKLGKKK